MSYKDIYYIFIEHESEKCVIRAIKDFGWLLELFAGKEPLDLNFSYSNKFLIDDIMDELRTIYDYVEEISFVDIDDYMED